jgi:hypothetical protein
MVILIIKILMKLFVLFLLLRYKYMLKVIFYIINLIQISVILNLFVSCFFFFAYIHFVTCLWAVKFAYKK